ncbi:MAG: hypothetical protein JWM25_1303 [Thermoleophilia bacterium]|nr:hypothetical protein [Thermoleophilia bacterium]
MVGAVRMRLGSVVAGRSWLALLGVAMACAAAAIILLAWRPPTSSPGAPGQSIVRGLELGSPEDESADDTVFGRIAKTIASADPVAPAATPARPTSPIPSTSGTRNTGTTGSSGRGAPQPTPTAPTPTNPVVQPPTGGTGTVVTPKPPAVTPPTGSVVTVRPPAATVASPLGSVAVAPGSASATLGDGTSISVFSATSRPLVTVPLLDPLTSGELTAQVIVGEHSVTVSVPGVGDLLSVSGAGP